MASKKSITLTIAGDADKLVKEEERASRSSDKMADDVGKASKRMGSETEKGTAQASEGLGKFGKAALGIGAVMATAGHMAVDAFTGSLDFDKAQKKLDAQLGNSEYAGEMGKVAAHLYAEGFGENIGEVNEAVRSVMGSGMLEEDATSEAIGNITAQVKSLGEAFDKDIGETTRAVGKAVKTGLVKDAQEGLDVITRGLQQNVDEAGDLMDTFSEYSTQFREVGLNGAQAMGLLVQGLRAGARDADVVADSIKEFTLRMKDGSVETAKGFEMLGLNGKEMMAKFAQGGPAAAQVFDTMMQKLKAIEDPAKRNAAALALFSTKAEDMGKAIFALDPGHAAEALGTIDGAAKRVNDTLNDTVENRVKKAKREFEEFGQSIAGINGPIGSMAVGVMAFGGDALTMASSLGMVLVALQQFGLFAKLATAAQWLWNAALSANPIGLIIIGIAALVAGFIYLWNNVEGFRNFWIAVWDAIVVAAAWVKDRIVDYINIYVWIFGVLKDAAMTVSGAVVASFHWIMDKVGQVTQWIKDKFNAVVDFFGSIPSRIGNALGSLGNMVGNAFTAALNWGIDRINWFVDKANSLIANVNQIPGVSLPSLPRLGRLHSGGIVPGNPGQETLAILEAGEKVIPADETRAGGGGNSGGTPVIFGSDGSDFGDALLQIVIGAIRKAGGDPKVLGV